jgi:hypothetical protein
MTDDYDFSRCCFCELAGAACVGCPDHPDFNPIEDIHD